MKTTLFLAIASIALLLPTPPAAAQSGKHCITDVRGNQVCGSRGQCALDRYNVAWCAPENGSAMKDRYDEVVCGAGVCVRDARSGEISCPAQGGGTTVTDPAGALLCAGGCVPASKSMCRRAAPN
ncbi:MAG: hypothetical protein H7Y16_11500 [Candidatus Parcubacteria bacterium]|nr:hypothetical protein [Burkholderiales bacterium]